MARPRDPQPVKLFCGLLCGDVDLLQRAQQLLRRRLGPIDLASEIWPFDQTDYYREEMGLNLKRQFVSFARPIHPDALPGIKHDTNAIEADIAAQCAGLEITRPVNLDPGYLDLGKLVLATTKDRSHRIYIGQRMFAEVTLHFMHGRWQTWPWTYPDYHRSEYHEFFTRVRDRFRQQRHDVSDPRNEDSA
jgi:hypothetical protein